MTSGALRVSTHTYHCVGQMVQSIVLTGLAIGCIYALIGITY